MAVVGLAGGVGLRRLCECLQWASGGRRSFCFLVIHVFCLLCGIEAGGQVEGRFSISLVVRRIGFLPAA